MNVKKVPADDYTVVVTLSAEDAAAIYAEMRDLLRVAGVHHTTEDRRRFFATDRYVKVYGLYDSLQSVGISGAES